MQLPKLWSHIPSTAVVSCTSKIHTSKGTWVCFGKGVVRKGVPYLEGQSPEMQERRNIKEEKDEQEGDKAMLERLQAAVRSANEAMPSEPTQPSKPDREGEGKKDLKAMTRRRICRACLCTLPGQSSKAENPAPIEVIPLPGGDEPA